MKMTEKIECKNRETPKLGYEPKEVRMLGREIRETEKLGCYTIRKLGGNPVERPVEWKPGYDEKLNRDLERLDFTYAVIKKPNYDDIKLERDLERLDFTIEIIFPEPLVRKLEPSILNDSRDADLARRLRGK